MIWGRDSGGWRVWQGDGGERQAELSLGECHGDRTWV